MVCGCAAVLLCSCESAPKPPVESEDEPGLTKPAVVMEAVTTFPGESIVTASSTEVVLHIETEHKQPREYWVMLGPYEGEASRGQLANVEQTLTDGAAEEIYLAPAWEVIAGYARLFGWFPIATSGQIIAGGTGTSFIIQRIEQPSGDPIIRVFLVNQKDGDAVDVSIIDGAADEAVVVEDEETYAQFSNGQLTLEPLTESERVFVDWVEGRAATIGLP
jgi:hypothetical protein